MAREAFNKRKVLYRQQIELKFEEETSKVLHLDYSFNPLNAELNRICHLLALLAHHIFHVSGLRVKWC